MVLLASGQWYSPATPWCHGTALGRWRAARSCPPEACTGVPLPGSLKLAKQVFFGEGSTRQ